MDRLPRELVEEILQQCVAQGHKNTVLSLRLVCRVFNQILKPIACRTIGLDFSRLNRRSSRKHPDPDALQTIGYQCKGIYIDLLVIRDDLEVDFLEDLFERVPSMTEFCHTLHKKYCMNDYSFTEREYFLIVETVLFNCRGIESLRLNLPIQLVGRHCNVSTRVLANTLKAFATRPEEDSADLETLVVENMTDIGICHLWMNPTDVVNLIKVLESLKHLVFSIRRHETEPQRVMVFGACFWNLLATADRLISLCLIGQNSEDRPPRDVKQTRSRQMSVEEWRARSLPCPKNHIILSNVTCLELKKMELSSDVLVRIAKNLGATLEELYLNEVYLKVEASQTYNQDSKDVLWVGLPNQRPPPEGQWVAMALRCVAPNLRICRASSLAYDRYLREDVPGTPEFDFIDPCGLSRGISQRFIEVVMGIEQPNLPNGDPIEYFPRDSSFDHLTRELKPRAHPPRMTDYDTNTYQLDIANTTSEHLRGIDGTFANINSNTLDELHYIAETACRGMNEMQRRRSQ
ncbi:hypothetical protein B0T10DRAFT_123471 [Thelonectria olida]|uniref:HTH cro/C1-type domain-containing protein n=1 Tax=Thelonectria olida TaxID=1576542 RepID=A0A9P8WHH2_9HYPO|nr:hypothetical protein B0T10DRAFT_123471 [Thelonectria olida]